MQNLKVNLISTMFLILLLYNSNEAFSQVNDKTKANEKLKNSTSILLDIVTQLKDSLIEYADLVEQGISEPALIQNYQKPLSISLLIENDTLYLVYSCKKMYKMATDMRHEKYLIPIKSASTKQATYFSFSLEKKQLVFDYKGIVFVSGEPKTFENIRLRITTKLSDINFKKVIDKFNEIGFSKN